MAIDPRHTCADRQTLILVFQENIRCFLARPEIEAGEAIHSRGLFTKGVCCHGPGITFHTALESYIGNHWTGPLGSYDFRQTESHSGSFVFSHKESSVQQALLFDFREQFGCRENWS